MQLLSTILSTAIILATAQVTFSAPTTDGTTATSSGYAPQFSPEFVNLNVSSEAKPIYNNGPLDTTTTLSRKSLDTSKYPAAWKKPDVTHPEVQAVINKINWDYVPKSAVRKTSGSDIDQSGYDEKKDLDCWWTASECVKPKVDYLPEDYYTCPTKGQWGLTYDDGPFVMHDSDDTDAKTENPYAEPQLYNYLAGKNLKASLFYIGSNVLAYPAAARRALSDGHTLCSHTWSHPPMTSVSNEEAVAELYWALKAIKEAAGVTVKCWRPPQGDVDDRIRAIAWQMGMRTVLWDKDTDDWAMPAPGGGSLAPSKVDAKFEKWIAEEKSGNRSTGVLVLEHELNHATIEMSEKWLPTLQKTFNVVSAMSCNGVYQPYWETDFVYPSIGGTIA